MVMRMSRYCMALLFYRLWLSKMLDNDAGFQTIQAKITLYFALEHILVIGGLIGITISSHFPQNRIESNK